MKPGSRLLNIKLLSVRRRRVAAALSFGLLAAALGSPAAPARDAEAPASVQGEAIIIDGDTLRIGATHIRLWGIDAPEAGQICQNAEPGPAASQALAAMSAGRSVTCTSKGTDRYGRMIAMCSVDGADMGRRMVEAGWAFDYPRYSKGAYSDAEATASHMGLGIHNMRCMKPWDWRAMQRR